MNTLKGWITTTSLAAILMVCTLTANAGIIVGGRTSGEEACKEPSKEDIRGGIIVGGLGGIIVGGFTGIIVGGLTGIIVGGAVDTQPVNCGIIVGG